MLHAEPLADQGFLSSCFLLVHKQLMRTKTNNTYLRSKSKRNSPRQSILRSGQERQQAQEQNEQAAAFARPALLPGAA